MIYQPSLFAHINSRYHAFKSEVLKDSHCETAQFWARYMDIIQMVLTLIMATRKTTLNYMSALSVCLVPNVQYCPTLQYTEMLRCKVEREIEAVSGLTNPFSSSFEDNELYFLSFGVLAKPGIAKDLIEADDIGMKAVADFIDSLLV